MSDNTFGHPIFHDDGDQLTMLTALLDAFPGQAGNPNVLVPIHPRVRQAWAQTLIERGVVVVPELMRELPLETGEHPEAGWMAPRVWVKREEYAQQRAAQAAEAPPSTPEQQQEQARQMLRAVKPSLLDQIDALKDPQQRAAMAARLEKDIPAHIDAVNAALEQIERARAKEGNDNA
ncbi:hypothetical protein IU459_26985 [Nocardia amamiensis]|uniref:Uncharacterized protein n=1 Tax=Nocardia amamiensis TaxID=404578 RepID=A0ABS0CX50_9NOCA|nr:Nif11-like leader peptide family natural product precursor [Nocardia amamiensis]MBF6301161.1 hypothetical protein [Nocardia amamiensis]